MRRAPTLVVAFLVVVVLLLYMFAFQVRFTETAVVTRFERPVDREVSTGLNFRRLPWPIEKVHTYDKRLRTYETQFTQLSTEDQKTLTVSAFATWRIANASRFLKAIGREEAAAEKIGDLLKNAVSKVLKQHPFSDLINTDPERIQYSRMESEIRDAVADDAMNSYGIDVAMVGISRVGLPEKNTSDVADRMKSERNRVSQQLAAEGEAEATRIVETAIGMARKIEERAKAYAKAIEGQGDALAANYYGVFRENPKLAATLKKLESLSEIFGTGENVVILDAGVEPFDVLVDPDESETQSGE